MIDSGTPLRASDILRPADHLFTRYYRWYDDNLPQEGRLLITDKWKNCFGRSVRTDTRPWLFNKLGPRRKKIIHSDPAWYTNFLHNNLMSRVFLKLPIIHNKALLRAARAWAFCNPLCSPPRELFNPGDICLTFVLSLCVINDVTSLSISKLKPNMR